MRNVKLFQLIFIVSVPTAGVAQDTIYLTKQRQLYAKVLEVEDLKVKYRKFENVDDPIYSVDKTEVLAIHYNNGTRDIFNPDTTVLNEKALTKDEFLKLIKNPTLKVFVTAADSASVIHARNALQNATTWDLVDEKSTSQIVVRFTFVSIGLGDKKGKAQFLDPKTDELIYETESVNTTFSWDVNTKRGVINRIVNSKIKKLIKSDSK
jgi:hypothetical protein